MSDKPCSYSYCDNLGVITGEEIIIKGKHYCKECYKQLTSYNNVKKLIVELLPDFMKMKKNWLVVSNLLTTLIVEKKYEPTYIEFTLNYIKKHKKVLRYIYGIEHYLYNPLIKDEYNNQFKIEKMIKMSNSKFEINKEETEFKFNTSNNNWTNII